MSNPNNLVPEGFIVKKDAAKVCGCCQRTLDNLMRRKMVPYYKFGRRVLFKREELIAVFNHYKVPERVANPTASAPSEPPKAFASDSYSSAKWSYVCQWLRLIQSGGEEKHAMIAKDCLAHIEKFIK